MDETHCVYASSYALLKLATHRTPVPIPDFGGLDPAWYSNLHAGSLLYVCPQALPEFVKKVLPTIQVPFKLITNNSDCTIPDDYPEESASLLSNPFLQTWFAQNCTGTHPKFIPIPIGMDYHSLRPTPKRFIWSGKQSAMHAWGLKQYATDQEHALFMVRNNSKPFWDRQLAAYANFQFTMWTRYGKIDRKDAMDHIPRSLVYYEPTKTTRDQCWSTMTRYAFVISPHGNGYDCHRTWEAIALGCIPIVKTSPIDSLYANCPVWIVHQWSDITETSMRDTIQRMKTNFPTSDVLLLQHWRDAFYH